MCFERASLRPKVLVLRGPGRRGGWLSALGLLLLLLLSGVPGVAGDWPIWLGPQEDNSSGETGWLKDWPDGGPPRLFEKRIGQGYSAIVVVAERLILFDRRADQLVVSCLGAVDGQPLWDFEYPTDYVDRYGYNGGPRCSPVVDTSAQPPTVYTLGPAGVLHALRLTDGKKLWRRDLEAEVGGEANFFGVGAAPVLFDGKVVVNLGGTGEGTGKTFALEPSTGKTLWQTPTGGGSYAAARGARIDGADQLFVFHRTGLSCLDPRDGREKWVFRWRSRAYESVNATTPVVSGDVVFISAAYNAGSAALRVKKETFEPLWQDQRTSRNKALESHWSNVNLIEGFLYGFSGRHESGSALTCLRLETGEVAWRWVSPYGRGSMLYSDGHFIALGESGHLGLLRLTPQGHQELERVDYVLRRPAWTPPVLAHGLLYLRDEEKLICMDLRAPQRGEKASSSAGAALRREPLPRSEPKKQE